MDKKENFKNFASKYPAIIEFNRRYNLNIEITHDKALNLFKEEVIAGLIKYKKSI